MQQLETDVLIIGAGLAGLVTALCTRGRRVTVLCSWMPPGGTASAMAQGGIAAAVGRDDSPQLHWADTLRAGAGACDPDAVRILCDEAACAVAWLEKMGAHFDRDDERWLMHREAAHSRARVLHINHDRTGFAISRALTRAARDRSNVEFLSGYHAVKLVVGPPGVAGVIALDRKSQPWHIRATDTVLATGGIGQLYSHTSNPRSACGDGLAMALAAGARCDSLEYVQFHPTALAVAADPMPLITEALRGAGARLVDDAGVEIMNAVHPAGALAPRDVVAREVARRRAIGRQVYLDARDLLNRDPLSFPAVRSLCANHHVEPQHERIPVAPAAHYHMGGVVVDTEGRTNLDHLWACGEVACTGVHGANRLASNSLLEAVVFGRRLGDALTLTPSGANETPLADTSESNETLTLDVDTDIWKRLRELMWKHAGIVRSETGLKSALAEIAQLERQVPDGQILLSNRLKLASSLVAAALAHKTSRGAHFREDEHAVATAIDADQVARPRTGT